MISKVLSVLLLVGCSLAQNYGDDQATGEQHLAPNYAYQGYGNDVYDNVRAEPYDFGFQSTDEFGTIMNRQESSDNNGAVRGSYGYTDPFGVFRHVDYVADENGFRAEVKSNEPGMGTASPANVAIYAEPPPAGVIIERSFYNPRQQQQGGQSGQASGQQPARRNPSGSASSNANRQVRPTGQGSGANARFPSSGSGNPRVAIYPYVQPQQNAFSSNALTSTGNTYPNTVSNQYATNAASAASGASTSGSSSSASNANQNQYTSGSSEYSSGSSYQASASVYPARNPYGSQGFSTLSASQYGSSSGSSSASSAQKPVVAKPYEGPTYKIGNPHITEYKKSEKVQTGSYLLPTVVTTGGGPTTLVKHIHAYPSAPVA